MFKPFPKLPKKGVKAEAAKAKPKAKAKSKSKAKNAKASAKAERSTMTQLGGFPPIVTKKGKKPFSLFS